jgi:hypothetical protein
MTVMSAAGVQRAFWYALMDEPWYPNMGLYSAAGGKPALDTYRTALRRLLSSGNAHRVPTKDPASFVYRFGMGPFVLWGRTRPLRLPAGAKAYDARGRPIPAPPMLGADPIVVDSPQGLQLG